MFWLHLYAAVQILFAPFRTVDRGCPAGTRSSLRPLSLGVERPSKARAKHAARGRRCVAMRVRAQGAAAPATHSVIASAAKQIQTAAAERFWIASLRSQ